MSAPTAPTSPYGDFPPDAPAAAVPRDRGMADSDLLREMGADAAKWASAFCKRFPPAGHGNDWGLMACWFANAIEAGSCASAPETAAERDRLVAALEDMLSGWRYLRQRYGDLPGVGWDRAENKALAALAESRKPESPEGVGG